MVYDAETHCQADEPHEDFNKLRNHNEPIQGFEETLNEVLSKNEGSWGSDWLGKHKRG